MEEAVTKPPIMQRFKNFLIECRRVWQVTKKPTRDELKIIVKVTGIGILIIGLMGFIVNVVWQLFLQ